jgi:hypothetical protein
LEKGVSTPLSKRRRLARDRCEPPKYAPPPMIRRRNRASEPQSRRSPTGPIYGAATHAVV